MPRFLEFPDLEAVAGSAIRAADLPNLGTRVYSSVPGDPTYPLAVVSRLGGLPVIRQYLDGPRIQVEVWGGARGEPNAPAKSVIHDIAQAARIVLFDLEGEIVTEPVDAFVAGVEDALGLTWLPDPTTGRDRYLFSVYLYGRIS